MEERKSPVDQALDLFVYAPIGLAVSAAEELPRLIDKGRNQVSNRTAMYRMLGQFAVAEGQQRAEKLAREAAALVGDLTTAVAGGWSAPEPSEPEAAAAAAPPPPPEPRPARKAAGAAANGHSGATTAPRPPAPASDQLAIPGYDALSASQVVQRLAGLSAGELEAVRQYEAATRGRKTILSRVAQLQSGG